MIKTDYDVLCVGNPFCDRSAYVQDDFFEKHLLKRGTNTITEHREEISASWNGAKMDDTDFNWTLGGTGTNVIKTLKHLGNRCAIHGVIGSDPIADKIAVRLDDIGVISKLSKGKKSNGIANCFITPDAERTLHVYVGSASEQSEENIYPEAFKNVKHVTLEGFLASFGKALEKSIECVDKDAKVSLDLAGDYIVELYGDVLKKAIPRVDYLFGNMQEMKKLIGFENIEDAFDGFSHRQTVVITDGANGCYVKSQGENKGEHYDAVNVPKVIDTTGAGDFFDAGFIHGTLLNRDVSDCVKMGNLAASFVIAEQGAELPQDKWHELKNRMLRV